MGSVTVLVAARRETARRACLSALAGAADVRVVGQARSPVEVLASVRHHRPHVLVLASPLGSRRTQALLDALSGAPLPRVLVVAARHPRAAVVAALARGVRGHLDLPSVRSALARAVRAIARGEAWCSRALVPALVARLVEAGPRDIGRWSNGRRARRRRG